MWCGRGSPSNHALISYQQPIRADILLNLESSSVCSSVTVYFRAASRSTAWQMQQQIDDMEVPLLNDSNSNRPKSLAQERDGFGGNPSTLTVCRGRGVCVWGGLLLGALNASSCYFRNMHCAKNTLSFVIWSSVTCWWFYRGYRHAFHEHAFVSVMNSHFSHNIWIYAHAHIKYWACMHLAHFIYMSCIPRTNPSMSVGTHSYAL